MEIRGKIHHVGVAVPDLESAATLYESAFGLKRSFACRLPERGVNVQFLQGKGTLIELLAPLGEDSVIQKFLDRHGPGMHHLCFEVTDIKSELERLSKLGLELIDRVPRPGAEGKLVAFVQPKSTLGVLIELQQS